jgi:putative ABC transport system substrate-binding protein
MLHASFHVEQGGLASYAADLYQVGRQTARLGGEDYERRQTRDIPVERPTRFELVVNRRTAATLGLTIPPEVVLRVHGFIE